MEGEIETVFRGEKSTVSAGQTVNIPANAPHQFQNKSQKAARLLCICTPAGQDEFFMEVGFRWRPEQPRRPNSTRRRRKREKRKQQKMVEEGAFREDLYFRLAVVPVNLPPLRTRREDIPLLVNYFFKRAKDKHGFKNLKMTREVVNALSNYSFSGNVRELENLIERMIVLSDENSLTLEDVPDYINKPLQVFGNVKFELPAESISLEEVEREIIRYALEMHNGNQSQTARYLSITRSALIYRLEKFNLPTN